MARKQGGLRLAELYRFAVESSRLRSRELVNTHLILRVIKLDWIACAATRLCQPRCRAVTTTATAAAAAVTASHIKHKAVWFTRMEIVSAQTLRSR